MEKEVEIKFENKKLKPDEFYNYLKEEIEKQKNILSEEYTKVEFDYFEIKQYFDFNEFGEIEEEKIRSYIVLYFFVD